MNRRVGPLDLLVRARGRLFLLRHFRVGAGAQLLALQMDEGGGVVSAVVVVSTGSLYATVVL